MSKTSDPNVDRCRSCGKPIRFAKNENGKWIPLDASAPVYRLVTDPGAGIPRCERERDCFVSHFATCPDASSHSRRRGKPPGGSGPDTGVVD